MKQRFCKCVKVNLKSYFKGFIVMRKFKESRLYNLISNDFTRDRFYLLSLFLERNIKNGLIIIMLFISIICLFTKIKYVLSPRN